MVKKQKNAVRRRSHSHSSLLVHTSTSSYSRPPLLFAASPPSSPRVSPSLAGVRPLSCVVSSGVRAIAIQRPALARARLAIVPVASNVSFALGFDASSAKSSSTLASASSPVATIAAAAWRPKSPLDAVSSTRDLLPRQTGEKPLPERASRRDRPCRVPFAQAHARETAIRRVPAATRAFETVRLDGDALDLPRSPRRPPRSDDALLA